jgi:hypothetical protein
LCSTALSYKRPTSLDTAHINDRCMESDPYRYAHPPAPWIRSFETLICTGGPTVLWPAVLSAAQDPAVAAVLALVAGWAAAEWAMAVRVLKGSEVVEMEEARVVATGVEAEEVETTVEDVEV